MSKENKIKEIENQIKEWDKNHHEPHDPHSTEWADWSLRRYDFLSKLFEDLPEEEFRIWIPK